MQHHPRYHPRTCCLGLIRLMKLIRARRTGGTWEQAQPHPKEYFGAKIAGLGVGAGGGGAGERWCGHLCPCPLSLVPCPCHCSPVGPGGLQPPGESNEPPLVIGSAPCLFPCLFLGQLSEVSCGGMKNTPKYPKNLILAFLPCLTLWGNVFSSCFLQDAG